MAQKKRYPGGFRLTMKTARELVVRELGTAKGLERETGMPEGFYHMTIGNLEVEIRPDTSDSSHRSSSGLIQLVLSMDGSPDRIVQFFWPDTLEQNFAEEEIYRRAHRRDLLEEWIERDGLEKCRRVMEETARLRGL